MKLKSVSYSENNNPSSWRLENFELGDINLLVGKNASGKSRSLNVILSLARLLSGRLAIINSGNFEATFENNGEIFSYVLNISESKIQKETFSKIAPEKIVYLIRESSSGKSSILSKQEMIDFQPLSDRLVAATRVDQTNHPFLTPLNEWAKSLCHFDFSNTMGRNSIVLKTDSPTIVDLASDTNQVIMVFKAGQEKFPDQFKKRVLADFNSIGYELEDISLNAPVTVKVQTLVPSQPICLWVNEKGVSTPIEQMLMSNGMFRALSLAIQITYSIMEKSSNCILIDDIGEGLDFERSSNLIDFLLKSVQNTQIQLIMASNERLVMNKVPLETWSIIERNGSNCKIHNYKNSKHKFDNFRFTGLSNFDFFKSDFLNSEEIE